METVGCSRHKIANIGPIGESNSAISSLLYALTLYVLGLAQEVLPPIAGIEWSAKILTIFYRQGLLK